MLVLSSIIRFLAIKWYRYSLRSAVIGETDRTRPNLQKTRLNCRWSTDRSIKSSFRREIKWMRRSFFTKTFLWSQLYDVDELYFCNIPTRFLFCKGTIYMNSNKTLNFSLHNLNYLNDLKIKTTTNNITLLVQAQVLSYIASTCHCYVIPRLTVSKIRNPNWCLYQRTSDYPAMPL